MNTISSLLVSCAFHVFIPILLLLHRALLMQFFLFFYIYIYIYIYIYMFVCVCVCV